jgi:NADPH-dependent ferric siderophore reductase
MSTDAPVRPHRSPRTAVVVRTEPLTPHLVRVVLGGPGLADLPVGECTDHYVKLQFPGPERSVQRAYTVRSFDPGRRELTIDFVVHGPAGVAGPWAVAARPGDRIDLVGPGGGYAPAADVDWHLFVGDESALPAIAASLERVPAGRRAEVFVEVEDRDDELALVSAGVLEVHWVHRAASGLGPGEELVDLVSTASLPRGTFDAFVHGEAGLVRDVRRHLRGERGLPVARLSASGYWRRGRTDEDWRAEKKDWKAAVENDDAALAPRPALR